MPDGQSTVSRAPSKRRGRALVTRSHQLRQHSAPTAVEVDDDPRECVRASLFRLRPTPSRAHGGGSAGERRPRRGALRPASRRRRPRLSGHRDRGGRSGVGVFEVTISILFGTRFLPMIPRSVVAATHVFEWAEVVVLGWNALEGSHPFFSQRWRPPAGASSSLAARWPVSPAPSWRCACTTVASPSASASPLTCSPARARPWAFRPSSAGWRPRRRARWRALVASIVPGPRGLASRAWSRAAAREASHGHRGTLRRPRPNDHLAWHLLGEPWAPCLVAVAPASLRVRISDRSFRPAITSGTIEVASPRCASTSCSAFAALQAPTRGSSPFCTRPLDIRYLA